MTVACAAPDPELGVALRFAGYLDCQSRALGENGFQALAASPATTALLAAAVTIFVALIGYRLLLGHVPTVRDGIGWAVRLGFVLALVTSWPAFQTLVFRVVTDGPDELAATIVPAAGLSLETVDQRVQAAYDRIRLGSGGIAPPDPAASPGMTAVPGAAPSPLARVSAGMPPLPRTAALFVLSSTGLVAALRLATGFLVAIGPLPILGLLFPGTASLFEGWVRALASMAFGVLAAIVTTAIELVLVESELAHIDAVQFGAATASAFDPEGLTTIVALFIAVSLAATYAAWRIGGAFRLPSSLTAPSAQRDVVTDMAEVRGTEVRQAAARAGAAAVGGAIPPRSRAIAVAEALSSAAYRDAQLHAGNPGRDGTGSSAAGQRAREAGDVRYRPPIGVAARRTTGRQSRSARRRDLPA